MNTCVIISIVILFYIAKVKNCYTSCYPHICKFVSLVKSP